MRPLVIYHADCADGFGAAFAAWLKLGDEAEYIPCQYGNIDVDLECVDRDVYILDFSFPREEMEYLFTNAKRVVWLDHHKTAFETFGFTPNAPGEPAIEPLTRHDVILDNNKSGAMLAWEYFHPGIEVPLFIQHIDDYDRWQFKMEGTKAFNKALWSYTPWSFEQWRDWFYDVEDGFNHKYWADLYTEGAAILRAHEQNVQSVVKGAARKCVIKLGPIWFDFKTNTGSDVLRTGLAANCLPHLQSDVGHELAKQSGTYGLLWSIDKDNVCKCSLRSNGDYDVSAIAKAFGGGGHKNAAGFSVDIQTLLGWIK